METGRRMKAAVVKETSPGERRVALVPDAVAKLQQAGIDVLVESGAGDGAWLTDASYADAGASIVSAAEIYRTADVILTVTRPQPDAVNELRPGQAVIGMLAPLADPEFAAALAARGVTVISLDGLPRTLSRAQPMDALTSQSNVAGYKAVLVAAGEFGRFFPLLITAGRTAPPGQGAGSRPRRGRPAGDRHRPPARRGRQRLRRQAQLEGRGDVARGHLHRADLGRLRGRRGRLRPRADRR